MGSHAAIAAEMSDLVRLAGGGRPGDSVGLLIRNASRALGIPHGRIRRLWYELAAVVPAQEADHLRAWRREHLARTADRLNAELAELNAQLASLNNDGGAA
ncbi:MAG: hypothetical protein ACRYHQ_32025 [Janthinobacterium lividum]